ncbi:hypothetical protein ACVWVY_005759 [Bradyrhizobium sp. URHC0002]
MAGFNDANGVVNPDGTVKGVAALRVADASIMSSDCRANTHFATMVIGEAIARMMMRKTDVSNNAAALALWEMPKQLKPRNAQEASWPSKRLARRTSFRNALARRDRGSASDHSM